MTQAEVYNLLKKNSKKWFSVKEIRKILDMGRSIDINLKKLHRLGDVEKKIVQGEGKSYYLWKVKKIEKKIRTINT
jgi:predicted transcriptional regulator